MADIDQPTDDDNDTGCHYHIDGVYQYHFDYGCTYYYLHHNDGTGIQCGPDDDHSRFDDSGIYRLDRSHAPHGLDAGFTHCVGC